MMPTAAPAAAPDELQPSSYPDQGGASKAPVVAASRESGLKKTATQKLVMAVSGEVFGPSNGFWMAQRLSTMGSSGTSLFSFRTQFKAFRSAALVLQHSFRRRKWRAMVRDVVASSGVLYSLGGTRFRSIRGTHGELLFVQHAPSARWYSSVSHGCVPVQLRLLAIAVVESAMFEAMAMMVILANCLFLAIQGPPGSGLDEATEFQYELAFMILFTLEVCAVSALPPPPCPTATSPPYRCLSAQHCLSVHRHHLRPFAAHTPHTS